MFRARELRSQPLLPSPSPLSPLTVPEIDAGGRGIASSDWLQLLRLLWLFWLRLGSRGVSGSFERRAPVLPERARTAPRSRPRPLRSYRSCAPPGKLGSARAPPTRTSREPGGRLAPPTAFAPPGLSCAAAAASPLVESVGCTSHQRESGLSPAPRRAFLKDQYPLLETLGTLQSRPKAVVVEVRHIT